MLFKSSNSVSAKKQTNNRKKNNTQKLKLPPGAERCSMHEEGELQSAAVLGDAVGAFVFLMRKTNKKRQTKKRH